MHFIAKILASFFVNTAALMGAAELIYGVTLSDDFYNVLVVAGILTALNLIVKPIVKLIMGPIILLTVGLGLVVVNGIMLFLLDFLSPDISIQGIVPLFAMTLLFSALNFVTHIATKS